MKTKFELEYTFNTSPKVLYPRFSTASGLSEWFADDVHINGKIFTFIWNGTEQEAELLLKKDSKFARFHWLDDEDPRSYFEFRLRTDELTGDVALLITDFTDEDDVEDATELWNKQISNLKHMLGL